MTPIEATNVTGPAQSSARRTPRYRSAGDQILNNPYLRSRLIVHSKSYNEYGATDYHGGEEVNPRGGRDKNNPFPRNLSVSSRTV